MPVHKQENTTSQSNATTANIVLPEDLKPENFHQYLRTEIRHATRMVMEEIMREELSGFLGAEWGESTPERKGYRNGFHTRDADDDDWPDRRLERAARSRRAVSHTNV